jgi:hypothetical protein
MQHCIQICCTGTVLYGTARVTATRGFRTTRNKIDKRCVVLFCSFNWIRIQFQKRRIHVDRDPDTQPLHVPGQIMMKLLSFYLPWFFPPYECISLIFRDILTKKLSSLKGPKREIFGLGIFAQIRPIWIGDLGTRHKNPKKLGLGP